MRFPIFLLGDAASPFARNMKMQGTRKLPVVLTPSVPNYKLFQESWRVTKIIEKNIKIYENQIGAL